MNNNIHPILLNTHIAGTHKGHVPGNQQGVLSNRGIQEGFVGLKIYFKTLIINYSKSSMIFNITILVFILLV